MRQTHHFQGKLQSDKRTISIVIYVVFLPLIREGGKKQPPPDPPSRCQLDVGI